MAQCNTLNAKLRNSQLNKLRPGIKIGTKVILNLSIYQIWLVIVMMRLVLQYVFINW